MAESGQMPRASVIFDQAGARHAAQQPHAAIRVTIKCTRPTVPPNSASAPMRHTSGARSLMRDVRRHLPMILVKPVQPVLPLLVFTLAACAPMNTIRESVEISLTRSDGYLPNYSSVSKTVSERMCRTGEVFTAQADLPRATLEKIAILAEQNGFFSLAVNFAEPGPQLFIAPDGSEHTLTLYENPCVGTAVEIAFRGKRHRIAWSCLGNNIARGRPEIAALEQELKPYFERLPPYPCSRY